jgi:hypothetical protein
MIPGAALQVLVHGSVKTEEYVEDNGNDEGDRQNVYQVGQHTTPEPSKPHTPQPKITLPWRLWLF